MLKYVTFLQLQILKSFMDLVSTGLRLQVLDILFSSVSCFIGIIIPHFAGDFCDSITKTNYFLSSFSTAAILSPSGGWLYSRSTLNFEGAR